ncbi:MAG TPA: TraB/GumN family protein [Chitinophagales bacterium]|nr:TraB/GumN family protein [Chitinophagales bacterium]HNM32224.1 TraB/GumN family protein [Chitinophagales bacterium]
MYGTIHLISQDDYFLGKNVLKKLQNSDKLVMEVDLEKINIAALTTLSVLDSGYTIRKYLSDTDYWLIQNFMEDSVGIKKFTFENFYARLKPFYLEQLLYFRYLGQEKESYEQNFNKIAVQKKIPTIGLETMEEQLQFVNEVPIETQLSSIVKTIKNYNTELKRLDTMVRAYKTQDLSALTKSFEEDEEDSVLVEKLVTKRNNNWIPKLQTLIAKNSCFIAVGAGHLGGKNGLIQLLQNKGYTVTPISIH